MLILPILFAALVSAGFTSRAPLLRQSTTGSPCPPFGGVNGSHKWIPGDHKVVPVSAKHQRAILQRLKRGAIEEVDDTVARAMAGNALPPAAHYYLARVGYIGDAAPGTFPTHVSIAADIDTEGVAYVISFVLSRSNGATEAAAVLTSPIPLKRMISSCEGAR